MFSWASCRANWINRRASTTKPLEIALTWSSIINNFSIESGNNRRLEIFLSAPNKTPWLYIKPRPKVPCSTILDAYSTWYSLPSGENMVAARSYAADFGDMGYIFQKPLLKKDKNFPIQFKYKQIIQEKD